jgi:hypothetical protein
LKHWERNSPSVCGRTPVRSHHYPEISQRSLSVPSYVDAAAGAVVLGEVVPQEKRKSFSDKKKVDAESEKRKGAMVETIKETE